MDSTLIVAIFSVVGGIVGGFIAIGGQYFLFKKESTFRKLLRDADREDKFKLIALDKRLEKHQEAYSHWVDLIRAIYDKGTKKQDAVSKCFEFWNNNCLYLDMESSKALKDCAMDVSMYSEYLQVNKEAKRDGQQRIYDTNEMWDTIMSVGQIISDGVGLPHLKSEGIIEYDKDGNKIEKQKEDISDKK